jgi:hypothetical protein
MSRMTPFSNPLMLGFEAMEKTLERVAKSGDGYPPYNIERVRGANGAGDRLRITLAVAGLRRPTSKSSLRRTSCASAGASRTMLSANFCIAASPRGSSSGCSCWPTACRWRART